jgi:hypothetical protein
VQLTSPKKEFWQVFGADAEWIVVGEFLAVSGSLLCFTTVLAGIGGRWMIPWVVAILASVVAVAIRLTFVFIGLTAGAVLKHLAIEATSYLTDLLRVILIVNTFWALLFGTVAKHSQHFCIHLSLVTFSTAMLTLLQHLNFFGHIFRTVSWYIS